MKTLIVGLFLLNFVTVFHELGHLLVAKWNGVKVRRYSLGFGKVLFSRKFGDTEYCLSLLPLGGYVRLAGMGEPDSECSGDSPESLYSSKSISQRMAIVAAGPVANYILAFGIFVGLNFFVGQITSSSRIMEVADNSAAMRAGIQKGDVILEINGKAVNDWEGTVSTIRSVPNGEDMNFLIKRGSERKLIRLGLKSGPAGVMGGETIFKNPYQFRNSVKTGASYMYFLNKESVLGFKKLFTGKVAAKNALNGPVSIISLSGQMLQFGIYAYISWIGMVSFAIGFMNFLPIPVVDGGHIALMILEIIRGKPLNKKVEEKLMEYGTDFLIMLAIAALYFDVLKLIK